MKILERVLILMILILLNCSIGYSQSNSSTGGLDSIKISLDEVKIINSKLIDYEYTKEELNMYISMNYNNEEIIKELNKDIKEYKPYKKKTKTYRIVSSILLLITVITIWK